MVQVFDQHAELNSINSKTEPNYHSEHYEQSINANMNTNNITSLSLSSSSLSSSSSSPVINSATTTSSASLQTFICILTDLTDASNTCKRHVINLSGSYTIEHLIREAANFYSYDPFTFNLMWKSGIDMVNLSNIQEACVTLSNLGLSSTIKNVFEIHEKEGPPKRIKIDDYNSDNNNSKDTENYYYNSRPKSVNNAIDDLPLLEPVNYPSLVSTYPARRNASANPIEFGPPNISSNGLSLSSSYFNYEDDSNTGYVGLINQAMTCYLNSLLQTLYMTPEFRNAIYRWKYIEKNDDDEGRKNIPFQLQRLFLNLQTSSKKSIQTHDLTKSFGWNSDDAFQQHDVQELSRVMFEALEKTFKGTEQQNLINELYQGKIKDYVKCLECNTESARVDVFLDVPLCIRPFGSEKTFESVEAAMDGFIQPEILDENNKYFCTKCNKMCKAHKGLKFDSFPYILSLQLKRFDFDHTTMSRFKLSNTVTFPEILNVRKYLDNEDTFVINESKDTAYDNNADNNSNLNSDENLTDHFFDNLAKEINPIKAEQILVENIDEIIKLDEVDELQTNSNNNSNNQNDDLYKYELFSIMIHSGSATGGHYYAYIKCFETDQWYNFNDEKVTKLDKNDISKAFGTSYSLYSSTTAYMLLYRHKNSKRNEKFIKIEEYSDHLKQITEREKKQQIEANILKEYMDNVCKIKVIVPNLDPLDTSSINRRKEKTINIHKDLTLDKAKLEILKDFNIELINQKCRILKFDTYNDLIEQSYKNETEITVFEALGFTKCPYNLCWYLEILSNDQEFIEYNSNDFKIKVMNLNITTFESIELFNIRLKDEATVNYLRLQIAQKLNCNPESIRMALEKPHSIYNYIYLSKNLEDSLKSHNFSRVSKVFIEYEDSQDAETEFDDSKFYYALDAIANMIQMTVYLPNEEQCDIFKRKTERHLKYIQNQRQINDYENNSNSNNNADLQNDQSSNTISSLIDDYISPISEYNTQTAKSATINKYERSIPLVFDDNRSFNENMINDEDTDRLNDFVNDIKRSDTLTIDDNTSSSMSTMSFQYNNQDDLNKKISSTNYRKLDQTNYDETDLNLIENHFKPSSVNNNTNEKTKKKSKSNELTGFYSKININNNNNNYNEMETSLDEGIGSSGSLSNNQSKSSPISLENYKSSPIIINEQKMNTNLNQHTINIIDDVDNENCTNHNIINNNNDDDDDDNDNETHLGDVVDRCEGDFADLDADDNNLINDVDDDDDDDDEEIDINVDDNENEINNVFTEYRTPFNVHDDNAQLNSKKSTETKQKPRVQFSNGDIDEERIPLKITPSFNYLDDEKKEVRFNTDLYDTNLESKSMKDEQIDTTMTKESYLDYKTTKNENRFIKSNLIENIELGTRILEIRMDKRIELNEFKSHISSYLNINNDNFRVFRICQNDLECELTSHENQFSYLTQNTKFLIKLGTPLKYGEYVLPVFKLNKSKGSFTYLCDFMITHGMSVLNHKELLRDDLKDECNIDIPIEKMRLRKKVSKRPGNILLDSQIFGTDIFVNPTNELCIEHLDEIEKKTSSKLQTSVYLRHWQPDKYELGDLKEIILEGNSYELLINQISIDSGIIIENLEVLKCKRDYPFKSPILELQRDIGWKDNFYLQMEKLEDGVCFYYRNRTLKLGEISDEKRREMAKEDNINFRPTYNISSKKETGVKIQVENN